MGQVAITVRHIISSLITTGWPVIDCMHTLSGWRLFREVGVPPAFSPVMAFILIIMMVLSCRISLTNREAQCSQCLHSIKPLSSRTMWQESFLLPAVKQSFTSKIISSHVKMLWFLNHRNSLFLPELVFSMLIKRLEISLLLWLTKWAFSLLHNQNWAV